MNVIREKTDFGEVVEIPRQFSHYKYQKTIGTGSSAVVILLIDMLSGNNFAGKVVTRNSAMNTKDGAKFLERETRIHAALSHPNVVRITDMVYLPEVIIIIEEYCSNGDLFELLLKDGPPMPSKTRRILFEIASGIAYLHHKGLSHRDLKPENIFLDDSLSVKIGDFGFVKEGDLCKTLGGTLVYAAPELFTDKQYDGQKADIWSLGIIAYVLSVGALPWSSEDSSIVEQEIQSGALEYELLSDFSVRRFVQLCCVVDPNKRPSIDNLLADQYFAPFAKTERGFVNPIKLHAHTFSNSRIQKGVGKKKVHTAITSRLTFAF